MSSDRILNITANYLYDMHVAATSQLLYLMQATSYMNPPSSQNAVFVHNDGCNSSNFVNSQSTIYSEMPRSHVNDQRPSTNLIQVNRDSGSVYQKILIVGKIKINVCDYCFIIII
jgi:hypothetical protein